MIDPEERTVAHLPRQPWRDEPGEWARNDGDQVAIYALVYRRRARAASTRAAVGLALSCLLAALLLRAPWLAAAGFAAGPAVYAIVHGNAQRMLRAQLDISAAALSACVERFMASPEGAATVALLERGDAQTNLRPSRRDGEAD